MSGIFMLCKAEREQILRTAVGEKVFAIMSYLSKDRWHAAKVQLTNLTADCLNVKEFDPRPRLRPIDIQLNQPVGVSFKRAYGKYVFDTTVVALKQSADSTCGRFGGTVVLAMPDRVEMVQRRSYFRVDVPRFLNVNVMLWRHNRGTEWDPVKDSRLTGEIKRDSSSNNREPRNYYHGKLVDISAGGAQVMLPRQNGASRDFRKGQYIGLRFTPVPYETPLIFNALIRNILPAEDHKGLYLGLQIVGLEASSEGRQILCRIVEATKLYYQLNLSGATQLDMQNCIQFQGHCSDVQQVSSQL